MLIAIGVGGSQIFSYLASFIFNSFSSEFTLLCSVVVDFIVYAIYAAAAYFEYCEN